MHVFFLSVMAIAMFQRVAALSVWSPNENNRKQSPWYEYEIDLCYFKP